MKSLPLKTIRPDNKGRICIGSLIEKGVSSFYAYIDKHHRIILEPFIEIPVKESWLHKNPAALASIKKGLEQSKKGQTKSLGKFSKHHKNKTKKTNVST